MSEIDTGLHYPITVCGLPSSWLITYAREVCEVVQSGFPCGQHSDDNIGVAHLRPMNISRDGRVDLGEVKFVRADVDERRLAEKDVLFNNTNSPELIGKTALVGGHARGLAFSNHMTRVRFNRSVLPKFGAYQLHYLWMARYYLHRCVKHVNQASISSRDFAQSIPIVVPPVTEQRRIVAKIEELFSELDKGVESLKTARAKLNVYRQAVLKQAFEGKLTAQWREENKDNLETPEQLLTRIKQERAARYEKQLKEWHIDVTVWEADGKSGKKPAEPKKPPELTGVRDPWKDKLPQLPENWGWVRVGDSCEVVRGGSPRPAGDSRYYDGTIPFLKVADLTRTGGVYLDTHSFSIKEAGLHKTRLVEPPILMLSNSGATLGVPKVCRIRTTFNDGIAAFLGLDENDLLYHYYFWASKTLELRAINQGAAQPNLNTGLIEETFIPLCSRKEMQVVAREVESSLSRCDQLAADIDTEIMKSVALRQAILKKAFAGQLIPQDPHDEPASVLLDRIRAEREKAVKISPSKKTEKKKPIA